MLCLLYGGLSIAAATFPSDTKRSLASSTAARSDHAPVASFFCSLSSANAPPTEWRINGPSIKQISLDSSLSVRYWLPMTEAAPINAIMRALADPTRRAVFEQVVSSDEITVVELTRGSGVTQGAISQHLKALKQAGLVAERPAGRRGPGAPGRLDEPLRRLLARTLCKSQNTAEGN